MLFVMVYVSFDMILGAYLLGNMTALIVKGSKTEKFRDKMAEVINYLNRNKLGKHISNEVKGHLQLQYETSYTEATVLQDIPVSIRAKVQNSIIFSFGNLKFLMANIDLLEIISSTFVLCYNEYHYITFFLFLF